MTVHLPGDFQKVISRLLEDINTPRSLAIALCIRYGDLVQAVSFRCRPEHYTDAERFARDNLATDFIRKCNIEGVSLPDQLNSEALERLMATERLCFQTNKRMKRFRDGLWTSPRTLASSNSWMRCEKSYVSLLVQSRAISNLAGLALVLH